MATVDSWFKGFRIRLMERLPRHDWPEVEDQGEPLGEYWATLKSRLVHHGVTEAEADRATALLIDAAPDHINGVWPSVLGMVSRVRAGDKPGVSPYAETNRAHAELLATRASVREPWLKFTEAQRETVRAAVLAKHPDLARLPKFLEFACLDYLAANGWEF